MHLSRPSSKRKGLRSDQVSSRGLQRFPRHNCLHVYLMLYSSYFPLPFNTSPCCSNMFQHQMQDEPGSDRNFSMLLLPFLFKTVAAGAGAGRHWDWEEFHLSRMLRGDWPKEFSVGLHGDWTMYILGRRDVIIVRLLSVLPCSLLAFPLLPNASKPSCFPVGGQSHGV